MQGTYLTVYELTSYKGYKHLPKRAPYYSSTSDFIAHFHTKINRQTHG
jgi:hypothetical protein